MLPSPRKLPKQSRSRLMFESIKQACHKILVDDGPLALNTNKIAEATGISVGSLYQYFENVDAVVGVLFLDLLRDFAASKVPYLEGSFVRLSVEGKLTYFCRINAELHNYFVGLHGEFYRKYRLSFDLEAELIKTCEGFIGLSSALLDSNFSVESRFYSWEMARREAVEAARLTRTLIDDLIEANPENMLGDKAVLGVVSVVLSATNNEARYLGYSHALRPQVLNIASVGGEYKNMISV